MQYPYAACYCTVWCLDSRFIEDPEQEFDTRVGDEVPIFLSTLGCNNDDEAIINCSRNDRLGLTMCDHSQDVYVRCQGVHQLSNPSVQICLIRRDQVKVDPG